MALTDKDILITPNDGSSTADPKTQFTGANSSASDTITLETQFDGSITTLSYEGSAGQLFSISNDLSGTIFAVNDSSGIPSLEINNNGEIRLSEFDGNVIVGNTNSTPLSSLFEGRLIVKGSGDQDPIMSVTDSTSTGSAAGVFHQSSTSPSFPAFVVNSAANSSSTSLISAYTNVNNTTGVSGTEVFKVTGQGHLTITGTLNSNTVNTGQGSTEVHLMNQNIRTTDAVTFATVNTGQGANELYAMNQNVRTTDAVTFATVNTGQGATEVHLMNQNLRTTDSPTFATLNVTGDLNITGDINTVSTTDLDILDKTITLGKGGSASSNDGAGIIVEAAGASLKWDNPDNYWKFNRKLAFDDTPTTTNQGLGIIWSGFDKEGTSDSTDNASIVHTTNTGGIAGSVLLLTSQNDSNDGIAFVTNGSSNLMHNSNKIWTAGNDGSGSGLDADTLDGINSGSFLRSDTADTATGRITLQYGVTSDFNSIGGTQGVTAFYAANVGGVSNRPDTGNYATGLEFVYHDTAARSQLAAGSGGSNNQANFYVRSEAWGATNSWTSWYTLFHTGNDGSGSGLDADTLDGINSGSFLRSDATDTASGTLSLNGRVNIGNSVTRPAALNSDSVAQARIGGSDVYLYVASLNSTGGYKLAMQAARASDFASFTMNLQSNGGALQRAGNTIWDAGNDGSGSGLDADTLDGVNSGSFLRSDATDTATGALTFEGSFLSKGHSSGDNWMPYTDGNFYFRAPNVYFDNNVKFQDGSGSLELTGDSSSNYYMAATGEIRVRPNGTTVNKIVMTSSNLEAPAFTASGNTVWHAGNDGSGSGLDADLFDGTQKSDLDHAEGFKTWTSINASATQAKRYHIARLYGCPAHWDGNWQNIEFHVTAESYESGTLKFRMQGDYGGAGSQANMIKLYLTEAHGPMIGRFRFILGSPVDAGWDHSGQDTYYVDLFAEAAHYSQWEINAKTYGHPYQTSNPTSGGATTVFYSSPTVSNVSDFNVSHNDTYIRGSKIWNALNDGSGSGLDADTLDGQHASAFLGVSSKAADSELLDGINSTSFLRSDTTDSFTGNELHFPTLDLSISNNNSQNNGNTYFRGSGTHFVLGMNSGNTLYLNYGNSTGQNRIYGNMYHNDTNIINMWGSGNDGSGSGLDADTLDGVQASNFLRSNVADTATQAITFSGGIVVDGSIDSGGSDYGFYQSAGTNIILKGDASGRSGIFFQSEKNGTNINHPSDYGFIQFHSYGYGGSSGESIDMVIGTANDSDDHLILQTPYTTGLKFGYRNATSGTGLTQVNIWHAANDGSGSGLDADTLDGINSGSFLRSDADDTLTGHLQINSHAINMDLNNVADDAITMREVRSSTWPLQILTNAVGNDNHSGFWVGSNGYPDMRLRRDDSTVRALISSWETSYVSNGFNVAGGNFGIANSNPSVTFHAISSGANSQFYFQSPTPIIRGVDSNLTTRYWEIGGENGSCNIAVDGGNAQGGSTFGVTIDGAQALYIDDSDRN